MAADQEDNLPSGYGRMSRGWRGWAMLAHAILMVVGLMFLLPLLWMASTSLKPNDQAMAFPPTWIPKATLAPLDGKETIVTKDQKVNEASVLVLVLEGPAKDQRRLLRRSEIPDAKVEPGAEHRVQIKVAQGGREVLDPTPVRVQVLRDVPVGYWKITEWTPEFSKEREQKRGAARRDCVPETAITMKPHAFVSNYNAAITRMDAKSEPDAAWYDRGFARYVRNTLWVCFMSVFGVVLSCTLVAYAFAFLDFPGRNILFAVSLAVMMIPFPATMVPLFDVFRWMGWVGTFKPLWAPAWFGGAFYIFLLRQFFLGLPRDLLDAARIDGCTELEILWHIVVPLARPALAMVALFQFIGAWKDFMGPMLYLTDPSQFTLSIGLQDLQSQHGGTPWNVLMAANVMFSLPLIVLFLLARKTFMRGIAMTGMKG